MCITVIYTATRVTVLLAPIYECECTSYFLGFDMTLLILLMLFVTTGISLECIIVYPNVTMSYRNNNFPFWDPLHL